MNQHRELQLEVPQRRRERTAGKRKAQQFTICGPSFCREKIRHDSGVEIETLILQKSQT
jgi:hypothetical protein